MLRQSFGHLLSVGAYTLHHAGDETEIQKMMTEDLHAAIEDGRLQHASELFMALREFLEETRSVH